jgi:hypothetical protein
MELKKRSFHGRKKKMKKLIFLIIVFSVLMGCVQKSDKAERIIENGVEVIINHLDPYKIKGEPSTFRLEEELIIDTEREDLADLGIGGIDEYDIDSEGSIYFTSRGQLFKFDEGGNFIQVIGRKGQGPGEYQRADTLRITGSGEISVYDADNAKFLFFYPDGTLKEEIKKRSKIFTFIGIYLDNGNFLLRERQNEPEKGIRRFHYVLLDRNFEKIKDLRPTFWIELPLSKADKISLLGYTMSVEISANEIFVSSNVSEDLEIEVYNFQGDLLRKVRKKSKRAKVTDEYKERVLERWTSSRAWEEWDLKNKHYFPDFFPPFKMFWVDDEERIFVETYEVGAQPGEVLLQIFNPEGIFIGTKSLKEARSRKFTNNRLYCTSRKESGYDELAVYKVIWE